MPALILSCPREHRPRVGSRLLFWCHSHAVRTIVCRSDFCGVHPSRDCPSCGSAISVGGSPGRRRAFDNWNNPAADCLDRRDDIADRVSATGAQIDAGALPSSEKVIKRFDMGRRKIADMNIVAHRGAIRSVIIGAENLDCSNSCPARRQ